MKPTDDDIRQINDDDDLEENSTEQEDPFIYLKSSSIISILIVVIFTLVCLLTTSLLIKTALHSDSITRKLASYLGFRPNRTEDPSILTYWPPRSLTDNQPIEIATTAMASTHSPPPPRLILSHSEKKAQKIFRNIFLPCLLLTSIICGFFAFYMRLRHHIYPAWGARPRRPTHYLNVNIQAPI